MNHLLVLISCILAAYPSFDPDGALHPILSKLSPRLRKVLALSFAFVLAVWQVWINISEERCSDRREKEQKVSYAEQKNLNVMLQNEVREVNVRLTSATALVSRLQRELDSANETLNVQQRSIGSLIYNIETSFEGKRRFANCFDALALLDDENDYKPLICDDGVALFVFAKKDDWLVAFHFYANSEINEVLSGMPIGTELKIENGKFIIAKGSELAMALERAQERRTPRYGQDAPSRRLAVKALSEQMRLFFRYVYRADRFSCGDTYRDVAGGRRQWGGWRLSFCYTVSPAKEDSCQRFVEFWMDENEIMSYCGLTMRQFSEKMLAYCRSRGVEPKIRIGDIDSLEKRVLVGEEQRTFPYSSEKVVWPFL